MKPWKEQWWQLSICLSQLLHSFVGLFLVPFGHPIAMADEAFSAAAYRKRDVIGWSVAMKVIDFAAWVISGNHDHCKEAYQSEMKRTQQHREYQ